MNQQWSMYTVEVLILHRLRNEKFKSHSLITLGLESNASNFLCHAVYYLDVSTFHTSPLQLFWRHYLSVSTLSTDFFPPSKVCFPCSASTQSRRSEVPHHRCSSDVCQRTKQMKVWWCGVWTIGLMRQRGPSSFMMATVMRTFGCHRAWLTF